ncbi:hypothetical protein [Schumannella sp. 10F1B-5-1]|uniref:hypothetical protein n=1 Tax=Schumannella sp. 10F1B-5-1 TaxID=2590780 RepID=UPI002106C2D3|nr:hypothetical protein [Schumannella sp. 10F1B-5-1]
MITAMLRFVDAASRALAPAEPVWRRLDRVGGGRLAPLRIRAEFEGDAKLRRGFAGIFWILTAEVVIGAAALVVAIVLAAVGVMEPPAVWFRSIAVLAITATLLYFAWRAWLGWYWAYSRLRLFSRIFPIVTLVIAAVPGLYPLWMVFEQILFSVLLVGVGDILTSDRFREAFPKPAAASPARG